MRSTSPPLMTLTWPLWKANWRDVLETGALSAGLESGALSMFVYMFIHEPNRVLPVVSGSFLVFWCFHVGISALHAKLVSHPGFSSRVTPIPSAV
jgi:hypothetical protein